jgi:two-component system LytT family response regulator
MAELRCVVVDDEPPARKRVRELLAAARDVTVVGEARTGTEAVQVISDLQPDVVFLDVQMPELDGFGVLAALETPPPAVVFVTAYDAYALKAFEVHALDYLLKPFDRERFTAALDRARATVSRHPAADDPRLLALLGELTARDHRLTRIAVKTGGRIRLVPVHEIEWIEASGNYLRLHVAGAWYLVRETMQAMEGKLDPALFARIHRSTIVNIEQIAELAPSSHGDCSVTLRSGARVTLSRTYREPLRARLGPEF